MTDPPAESGTADPDGSGSGDASSGATMHPACGCVAQTMDFLEVFCELDELCEPIQVACGDRPVTACTLADMTVVNPELLACHHQALAEGTPGALRWELPAVSDPGTSGQRQWVVTGEDRQALIWREAWAAPSYDYSDVEVVELRAAEHFDGCADLATPEEVFACLFDVTDSDVEVCVPAYSFPFG